MNDAKTYELQVAGLTRYLPLCPINDRTSIAAFIMFSDVELTVACAAELLKKAPEFDVILTAESMKSSQKKNLVQKANKRACFMT